MPTIDHEHRDPAAALPFPGARSHQQHRNVPSGSAHGRGKPKNIPIKLNEEHSFKSEGNVHTGNAKKKSANGMQ